MAAVKKNGIWIRSVGNIPGWETQLDGTAPLTPFYRVQGVSGTAPVGCGVLPAVKGPGWGVSCTGQTQRSVIFHSPFRVIFPPAILPCSIISIVLWMCSVSSGNCDISFLEKTSFFLFFSFLSFSFLFFSFPFFSFLFFSFLFSLSSGLSPIF